jgi:hypothetical protein
VLRTDVLFGYIHSNVKIVITESDFKDFLSAELITCFEMLVPNGIIKCIRIQGCVKMYHKKLDLKRSKNTITFGK